MGKKFYKIIIIPYTLFLLYLMFLGMGRFRYEDHLITVEPVFSTIKFIRGTSDWKNMVTIVLGNVVMFTFWVSGLVFPPIATSKATDFYIYFSNCDCGSASVFYPNGNI